MNSDVVAFGHENFVFTMQNSIVNLLVFFVGHDDFHHCVQFLIAGDFDFQDFGFRAQFFSVSN